MSTMSATGSARSAGRGARRAGSRAGRNDWVEKAGRFGHLAKGVSYALIAILALQVAFGQRGQNEDREGVLREVAGKSFGVFALWVLAVGFAAYAVWRFANAILDRKNKGSDAKGLAKRAENGVSGAVYVLSAIAAASLAMGSSSGSSGNEDEQTAKVMEWPAGRWIVGIVALVFIGYGVMNVWKAKTQKFRRDLNEGSMKASTRRWTTRSGVIGYAARGVVFAIIGWFLGKAAVEYDPQEAIGIDGALAKLTEQSYGTILLALVAAGLLAYAIFCVVQAKYRRM